MAMSGVEETWLIVKPSPNNTYCKERVVLRGSYSI